MLLKCEPHCSALNPCCCTITSLQASTLDLPALCGSSKTATASVRTYLRGMSRSDTYGHTRCGSVRYLLSAIVNSAALPTQQ